ncbi:hypothetical protein T484DRAFT_1903571 [Baffinella frigidus]|nr:hypothetical protein T484DRAFT_1903571 [Cryptophyta sp. CCMP2293]
MDALQECAVPVPGILHFPQDAPPIASARLPTSNPFAALPSNPAAQARSDRRAPPSGSPPKIGEPRVLFPGCHPAHPSSAASAALLPSASSLPAAPHDEARPAALDPSGPLGSSSSQHRTLELDSPGALELPGAPPPSPLSAAGGGQEKAAGRFVPGLQEEEGAGVVSI